jgi:hypothetical protein
MGHKSIDLQNMEHNSKGLLNMEHNSKDLLNMEHNSKMSRTCMSTKAKVSKTGIIKA